MTDFSVFWNCLMTLVTPDTHDTHVPQKHGDYGFVARKLRDGLAEITARYFLAENADFKSPAEIKEIKEMVITYDLQRSHRNHRKHRNESSQMTLKAT